MGDKRWEEIDGILDQVLDLRIEERDAFLRERCPDPELRARVEQLVVDCERDDDTLVAGGALGGQLGEQFTTYLDTSMQPHDSIPGYEFIRLLGAGGMGNVWEAEQTKPVQRRVAVKIIRPELDSQRVVARFESERQTLALMNHPRIARIFDAGLTDKDRPYFAMELVDGKPLNEFCDETRLGIRSRLRLFIEICEAIQHAHQKGVIHRDLKPSNVLVTCINGRPVPKVIDFGIARLVETPLNQATLMTEAGAVIGTPEFMSPEQAGSNPADVDTRSDVYSLGVLLYELLTGALPHRRTSSSPAGLADLLKEIREIEVPLASKCIASLGDDAAQTAVKRGTDSWGLTRKLKRELDWITARALEKDRSRRYESVGELAEDLRRFLRDEPVEAGPPGAVYRFRKFVSRNSSVLAASVIILLALIAGLIGTMTGLVRAQREAARAQTQAAIAEAVNEFLNDDLLAAVAPEIQGRDVTMQQVLAAAAAKLEGRFEEQPVVEAALRQTIGQTYMSLGRLDEASIHFERALELREAVLGSENIETLEVLHMLGELRFYQGKGVEAAEYIRRSFEGRERLLGPNDVQTLSVLSDLGAVAQHSGQLDIAEESYREAYRRSLNSLDPDDPIALAIVHNLGALLFDLSQHDEAADYLRQSYEGSRRTLGEEHPETLTTLSLLGSVLRESGKLEEAEPIYNQVYEARQRVLGEEHHSTLTSANNFAVLLENLEKYDEAVELHLDTLKTKRRTLGDEHDATILSLGNLGVALTKAGRATEGEPYILEALSTCERILGPSHSLCISTKRKQGQCWSALKRYEDAESALLEAHTASLVTLGPDHDATHLTVTALVRLYEKMDRPESADRWRVQLKPES